MRKPLNQQNVMKNKRINVAVLFGGKSAEHEVSLRSAKNVIDAMNKKKYNPVLIGISKSGHWLPGGASRFLLESKSKNLAELNRPLEDSVALVPQSEGEVINLSDSKNKQTIDVVFPVLHGTFGEDGTLQGLLKLADVPFVGAGVLGSAVGMDKDVMKRLLREAKIPTARFLVFRKRDKLGYESIAKKLGSPFFIKPANLGSSVGVSKVKSKAEFKRAVREAFKYDTKILVEEFIRGREIECSVLGNDSPVASVPGEVVVNHDFYSYEAKYLDENGASLEVPAKVPKRIADKIRKLAVETFKTLACEGMGRVDLFLKDNGKVLVNEINTIPGFTSISMYPRLWEASGISYSKLIDKLIQLAILRFKRERKLKTSY